MDPRKERTRQSLFRALVELIVDQGYDSVSIEAICLRAGVGRSTFYTHFRSKDDLASLGIEASIRSIFSAVKLPTAGARGFSFCLPLFRQALAHPVESRVLFDSAEQGAIRQGVRRVVEARLREELAAILTGCREARVVVNLDFTVQFLVGAFMTVVGWWLAGGSSLSPEEVVGRFQGLAAPVLESLVKASLEETWK